MHVAQYYSEIISCTTWDGVTDIAMAMAFDDELTIENRNELHDAIVRQRTQIDPVRMKEINDSIKEYEQRKL